MSWLPTIPRGRDFWSWPPAIVALALITAALATSAARIVIRERAIARERQTVEERIQALEAEKQRLEEAIRALESPEAVERLAKEQLNLKKEGEEVVVVVPERSATASPPAEQRFGSPAFLLNWIRELIRFLFR